MDTDRPPSVMTIDEVVAEAIRRERMLMEFYERAMDDAGSDVRSFMANLHIQHSERIIQLERLREKISEPSTQITDTELRVKKPSGSGGAPENLS